jgi:hypothetical protein
MNWNELKKEIYYNDGSLRDIYIKNTSIEDNKKWCNYVSANYSIKWFNGLKQITEDRIDFEVVKGYLYKNHDFCSSANIFLEKIQINNHFFIESEIENDISPNEINNIQDHERIIKFMTEISYHLDKTIILTPENEQEYILIRITKDLIEYLPED